MKKAKIGAGLIAAAVGTGYLIAKVREEKKSPLEKLVDKYF